MIEASGFTILTSIVSVSATKERRVDGTGKVDAINIIEADATMKADTKRPLGFDNIFPHLSRTPINSALNFSEPNCEIIYSPWSGSRNPFYRQHPLSSLDQLRKIKSTDGVECNRPYLGVARAFGRNPRAFSLEIDIYRESSATVHCYQ